MYDNGLSFSAKFMYDYNTKTDMQVVGPGVTGRIKPGQEFHVDYAVDYELAPGWRGGLAGYYYKQLSDDEINGVDSISKKSEALAIGPAIKYDFKLDNQMASLIAKVLFDVDSESWLEGESYWLKFVYQF